VKPATNRWLMGARVRTLPAAVAPVAVGTAVGASEGPLRVWRAVAALVVALALQVGVNYANDYQDGIKGTDRERVGPTRLVASGLAAPAQVRAAAFVSFTIAAAAGAALAIVVSPWLLLVGAVSIAAAWAYTGGPHPYGYAGLGEVFVFMFFGVVATTGSSFVQHGRLSGLALACSVPLGLLAAALLAVNNLRDRPRDELAGKRTLAVRFGESGARRFYAILVTAALVCPLLIAIARPRALIALVAAPLALPPLRRVLSGAQGVTLVAVLGETARLQLVFAGALAFGVWPR
jgi:1,4-dihydroxy-2-naphthoate octaprenyltransferase